MEIRVHCSIVGSAKTAINRKITRNQRSKEWFLKKQAVVWKEARDSY